MAETDTLIAALEPAELDVSSEFEVELEIMADS
jgi:hypothetical protein